MHIYGREPWFRFGWAVSPSQGNREIFAIGSNVASCHAWQWFGRGANVVMLPAEGATELGAVGLDAGTW
jgi:hypothetical protein